MGRAVLRAGYVSLCAVLAIGHAAPAWAENLKDAMIAAYRSNPGLDAERARLRATDEDVPYAKSGYRPTITGQASIRSEDESSRPDSFNDGHSTPSSWGVSVRQPVFDGFRTPNAVSAAEASVRAGQAQLAEREAATLLEAVTAYMDVVRDQFIVRLREANVGVLSRELEVARARRAVKEVTVTDVAQARARRARAVSAADLAKANLRIARAKFLRVVGHSPDGLVEPSQSVPRLPSSLAEAQEIAQQESPKLIGAVFQEQAAKYTVDKVWGELLPQVDVEASYSRATEVSAAIDQRNTASITGRLRIPFYQGGAVHARVRKAKHTHVSRLQEIEQARADVTAQVTSAWSRLMAARAQLDSDIVQVSSARLALTGVREEERVGQRMLLDVLNAEQELLDARVSLVATRRDLVVASYALLASVGRLSAHGIALATDVYEPDVHFEEVHEKWAGVTITRAEHGGEDDAEAATEEEVPPSETSVREGAEMRRARNDVAAPSPEPDELARWQFSSQGAFETRYASARSKRVGVVIPPMALNGPVAGDEPAMKKRRALARSLLKSSLD